MLLTLKTIILLLELWAYPNLGIQSLEKIFLHYGYRRMDHYFPLQKLDAYWYAGFTSLPPDIYK